MAISHFDAIGHQKGIKRSVDVVHRTDPDSAGDTGRVRAVYEIGPEDRAHPVPDIPQPDPGATQPTVVSDDHRTVLVYYVAQSWPDDYPAPDEHADSFDRVATVTFRGVRGVYFGAPNDEALDNHPLYQRGLGFYGAFRVEPSSWAASLERLAIKRGSDWPGTPESTHYILSMHDGTFECVAQRHTSRVERVALRDAILAAASEPRL